MTSKIGTVVVVGAGTMGSGIAALAAAAGLEVRLLEPELAWAERGLGRALATAETPEERAALEARIKIGTIAGNPEFIAEGDWICEAIIEDLDAKRALFAEIDRLRHPGSLVSTNTSGIRLAAIAAAAPASLVPDLFVTHFFNPVRVMKLLELVPGAATRPEVIEAFTAFGHDVLKKGVVRAKDTVNFIGNRIGCYNMLAGLHRAEPYLAAGLDQETLDALLGKPVGLPTTGLFGLIDLIGLDVMDLVGKNLADNLPAGDAGLPYTRFPARVQAMLDRGQLGRKASGGFARVTRSPDGAKIRETYDLTTGAWRPAREAHLPPTVGDLASLFFADGPEGAFVRDVLGGTILYAADLLPEIADDIVAVDRAMRWGFAWAKGPFELIDALGPARLIARLEAEGRPLPRMLALLKASGAERFYADGTYLALDGSRQPVPAE